MEKPGNKTKSKKRPLSQASNPTLKKVKIEDDSADCASDSSGVTKSDSKKSKSPQSKTSVKKGVAGKKKPVNQKKVVNGKKAVNEKKPAATKKNPRRKLTATIMADDESSNSE